MSDINRYNELIVLNLKSNHFKVKDIITGEILYNIIDKIADNFFTRYDIMSGAFHIVTYKNFDKNVEFKIKKEMPMKIYVSLHKVSKISFLNLLFSTKIISYDKREIMRKKYYEKIPEDFRWKV